MQFGQVEARYSVRPLILREPFAEAVAEGGAQATNRKTTAPWMSVTLFGKGVPVKLPPPTHLHLRKPGVTMGCTSGFLWGGDPKNCGPYGCELPAKHYTRPRPPQPLYTAYEKVPKRVIWENLVIVESMSYRVLSDKRSSIRTVFRHPSLNFPISRLFVRSLTLLYLGC